MIVPTLSTITGKATLVAITGPLGALILVLGNTFAVFEGIDATLIAGAIWTVGLAIWGVLIVGYGKWHQQRIEAIAQYEEAFRKSLQGKLKTANTELKESRSEVKMLREENDRLARMIDTLGERLDARNNDSSSE